MGGSRFPDNLVPTNTEPFKTINSTRYILVISKGKGKIQPIIGHEGTQEEKRNSSTLL